MRISPLFFTAAAAFLHASLFAATFYVDLNCATPTLPYTNWATAATNIQNAVDVANVGDVVLVTNGEYGTGGRVAFGTVTNRVAVTKPITLRSVNGPNVTFIRGFTVPGAKFGTNAVRCVSLANGSGLDGFTIINGSTSAGSNRTNTSGGGVWCQTTNATITNCVLSGNSAFGLGGGNYQGTLNNCTLSQNSAQGGGGAASCVLNRCSLLQNSGGSGGGANNCILNYCTVSQNSAVVNGGAAFNGVLNSCVLVSNSAAGSGGGVYQSTNNGCAFYVNSGYLGGGAYQSTLNNCTLTLNQATTGGGSYNGTLNNCICFNNTAVEGANYYLALMNYCCTAPLPGVGAGNFTADPGLASLSHLSFGSPCIGKGSLLYSSGLDIDSEPWANPPSIGCDELFSGSVTGPLAVSIQASYTTVSSGFEVQFLGMIDGRADASQWEFGDGSVVSNRPAISHAFVVAGDYVVALRAFNESKPAGVSATIIIHVVAQPVHYVALGGTNALPPYNSWATAATNIQDAVDAASATGALVLVSNGVYCTGGNYGGVTSNRVSIYKPIIVQSVSGPSVTIIQGYQVPGTTNGSGAMRCVGMGNSARLVGFTLTGGATGSNDNGGGAKCDLTANIYNCVLAGNSADYSGGGSYQGYFTGCTFVGNTGAFGGATAGSVLTNCVLNGNFGPAAASASLIGCSIVSNSTAGYLGGGAYDCELIGCTVGFNNAGDQGGGMCFGSATDCKLVRNSCGGYGGGAYQAILNRCSIHGNSASYGGGAYFSTLNSCAVYGNSAVIEGGGSDIGTNRNCTILGNTAAQTGGGCVGSMENCIVYYNLAPVGANIYDSSQDYSCTTPWPESGTGNFTTEPELASPSHLSTGSPYRGKGSPGLATFSDIDSEVWVGLPSVGCDEVYTGSLKGALSISVEAAYTNVATGFEVSLSSDIDGRPTYSRWNFGDGSSISNRPFVLHHWNAAGDYGVLLTAYNESNPGGVSATVTVHVVAQPVHYVAPGTQTPVPPYSSWLTAATNIQDAVDAAHITGALVLVSNGLYAVGARQIDQAGGTSNRVVLNKPIVMKSVNGPAVTVIQGYGSPTGSYGSDSVRCVYLGKDAKLIGFTLTGGSASDQGGAVWCEPFAEVWNCSILSNSAPLGGGSYQGFLSGCSLLANSAGIGGGSAYASLTNCLVFGNSTGGGSGGGTYYCSIDSSQVISNSANWGGGADVGVFRNSCFIGNLGSEGGAAEGGLFVNCVLENNSATDGGGAYVGSLYNCLLVENRANFGGAANSANLANCTIAANAATNSGGGI